MKSLFFHASSLFDIFFNYGGKAKGRVKKMMTFDILGSTPSYFFKDDEQNFTIFFDFTRCFPYYVGANPSPPRMTNVILFLNPSLMA